jgi:hypothetical protein
MPDGTDVTGGTPARRPNRDVPEPCSQAQVPHASRIVARILTLAMAERATTVRELHDLATSTRGRLGWNDRVRAAFTARRLEIERAWAGAVSWELVPRAEPCPRCFSPWVRARGYGTWCTKCVHACAHTLLERIYGVVIKSDGSRKPVYACGDCGGLIDARRGDPRRGEHVFRDLRTTAACARCGRLEGTQSHHWAPRAIFGTDADNWPLANLCIECHHIWHQMMRRAGGYRLPDDQRGDTLPSAVACHQCKTITARDQLHVDNLFGKELCPPCADRALETPVERAQ